MYLSLSFHCAVRVTVQTLWGHFVLFIDKLFKHIRNGRHILCFLLLASCFLSSFGKHCRLLLRGSRKAEQKGMNRRIALDASSDSPCQMLSQRWSDTSPTIIATLAVLSDSLKLLSSLLRMDSRRMQSELIVTNSQHLRSTAATSSSTIDHCCMDKWINGYRLFLSSVTYRSVISNQAIASTSRHTVFDRLSGTSLLLESYCAALLSSYPFFRVWLGGWNC